jgi:HD-GYP domain-containing protein (c-di-GMP phosphodiesterase class II)
MPVNTYTGEIQTVYNWLLRLLVFSFIGCLVGLILGWVKESTRELIQYNRQLSDVYHRFLMSMVNTLEARDPDTRFHYQKVALLSVMIGKRMGLEPAQLSELYWAAILHDLGKIGVPNEILMKKGPLEKDEWEVMKAHSMVAEEIIKPVPFLNPLLTIIRSHHEKWDGSGYPDGLEKESIPLLARIITVADVFDAMLSERPYHKAGDSIDAAKEYIVQNKGILFDPEVVDALEELNTGLLDRIRNIKVLSDLEAIPL